MTRELPNFELSSVGRVGRLFVERGVLDFRSAVVHVRSLPYGRTSSRSDPTLVLAEGRGTCSAKHALLRELAREHAQPVHLYMGIYEMKEANTPGVGRILEDYGLMSVPEVHCYLKWDGTVIDATGLAGNQDPTASLLYEELIEVEQVTQHKVYTHRAWLGEWAAKANVDPDRAWAAREACIGMLELRSASFG